MNFELPQIPMQPLLDDISAMVAVPSVRSTPPAGQEETMPFGEQVNRAIEVACDIGRRMGFDAKNLGYGALIVWPCGKENAGRLCIAAHLDVVAAGDNWATDPFTATVVEGNLWGRGTLDDKGPGLGALHGIYALKQAGYQPNVDIHFFFGGNEESGMADIRNYVRD